jgi:CRP-like cAMP-binding protein
MKQLAGAPRNGLLAALPLAVNQTLSGHIEPVVLARGTVLTRPDAASKHVYFLDAGMASLVKIMSDGRSVEVGAVGIDGIVGIAPIIGMEPSAYEVIMQVGGRGRSVPLSIMREAFEKHKHVKALFLRYMSYREDQLAQTAACNRLHTLRQRCCRWLLTAHDNCETAEFALTHEFLALMMGVNRPALSLTVESMQRRHIIKYRRASLTILERRALEEGACECYAYLAHARGQVFRRD